MARDDDERLGEVMKQVELEGVKIKVGSWQEWLEELERHWGEFWGVAPIALHPLVVAKRDKEFKEVLKAIDSVLPDSVWHRWLIWWRFREKASSRFYGPELMRGLIQWLGQKRGKVWLFGGKNERQMERLEKWVKQVDKRVEVESLIASNPVKDEEVERLVKLVGEEKGVVFLGIGSPRQQELVLKLRDLGLKVPVVAVGAAFDFWSGEKKICPSWLRRLGLEWLWRLIQEPKRLGRRYWQTFKWLVVNLS